MKKLKWIPVVCIILFCSACSSSKHIDGSNYIKHSNDISEIYEVLNQDFWGVNFLDLLELEQFERYACDYAESVQGEFVPIIVEDGIFPERLVVMLEEAFYQSSTKCSRGEDSAYQQILNALGAEEYLLEPEDIYRLFSKLEDYREQMAGEAEIYDRLHELYMIPNHTERCYHFHLTPEQDNYAFLWKSGGSNGAYSVRVTERIGDEFIILDEFEVQNCLGPGGVIQYEEEFYYLFLEYNYNLKQFDGIRLHRLTENPLQENLQIRYLPQEYVWNEIEVLRQPIEKNPFEIDEQIDEYLESIKEEITSDVYLDIGNSFNGIYEYYGEEEKTTDFVLESNPDYMLYKMDIANMGIPVYLWKSVYVPSNISTSEYLRIGFYLYDAKTDTIFDLTKLEDQSSYGNGIALMQIWFKEFDGKVCTFRIYHICDYTYLLDVVLLEADGMIPIKSYLLAPKRKFVLTEGEPFVTWG